MFLLGLLFVMMASGFALLWVYAGGDLSAKNIRKTMPVLRRDVDAYFLTVGKKAEVAFEGARPYVKVLPYFGRAFYIFGITTFVFW